MAVDATVRALEPPDPYSPTPHAPSVGLLLRSFVLGVATGSRSTMGLAAAALSGARALEVEIDHQALLNLVLIAVAIVGYLLGVLLAAGLIGAFGFGVALAVAVARGLRGGPAVGALLAHRCKR